MKYFIGILIGIILSIAFIHGKKTGDANAKKEALYNNGVIVPVDTIKYSNIPGIQWTYWSPKKKAIQKGYKIMRGKEVHKPGDITIDTNGIIIIDNRDSTKGFMIINPEKDSTPKNDVSRVNIKASKGKAVICISKDTMDYDPGWFIRNKSDSSKHSIDSVKKWIYH